MAQGLAVAAGAEIDDDFLAAFEQVEDVVEGALAQAVPQHESVIGLLSHRQVLGGVIKEVFLFGFRNDLAGLPVAEIVAWPVARVEYGDL